MKEIITFDKAIRNGFDSCTGVLSAVSHEIKVKLNNYGIYEYQGYDGLPEETKRKIELICSTSWGSSNESIISKELFGNNQNILFNPKIGYYQDLYVGHVKNDSIRMNSSSGGITTWLLKELLNKKMVDGIIQVSKNPDESDSILFKYSISYSVDEVLNSSKTRYYPVELSQVINQVIDNPGKYAVVGLPSYLMELRLLAKSNNIVKDRIRFMIGLVCGHQKSSKFSDYLGWHLGFEPGTVKNIDFRKKISEQPASDYGIEVTGMVNGQKVSRIESMHSILGKDWGEGFFKVKASDYTDDVMNETADITLGDAWLEDYTKDSKGNNIVIVRNTEISDLIKEGIKNQELEVDDVDCELIIKSQSSHFRHTQDELGYRLWKLDRKKQWHPQKRIKSNKDIPYIRRKIQDQREKIYEESHINFIKAVEINDFNYFIKKMKKLDVQYSNLISISRGPKFFLKSQLIKLELLKKDR